jgi:CubicO group peptidase (beta-lactamase class C family)
MKVRSTCSLLVLTVFLLNSIGVFAQQGGLAPKTLKFDKEKFIATVNKNKLSARILDGYAAVIINKDGNIVAEVAGGSAIRGDGGKIQNVPMTTSTPADIGSNFKVISFITVLSLFEKRAAQNPALTVEKQLNSPILTYLPQKWRLYITSTKNPDVARIAKTTFAQLMAHKSGFRKAQGSPASPFNYISTGIKQDDIGDRVYSNFNATVVTYLLPRLTDAAKADNLDTQLAGVANNDHPKYGKAYGDYFENWMQLNVFDKLLPSAIRPSCDPGNDFPKRKPPVTFARYYETPLGEYNPEYWSEKDNNYGCHAQGGYYLSMRQLAQVMANLLTTNNFISEKTRKMMYDDSTEATREARIVWFNLNGSPFAKEHFGVNALAWHSGEGKGNTATVNLPGGYIAVGTTTGPGSSGDVYEGLKEAWGEAVKSNFP